MQIGICGDLRRPKFDDFWSKSGFEVARAAKSPLSCGGDHRSPLFHLLIHVATNDRCHSSNQSRLRKPGRLFSFSARCHSTWRSAPSGPFHLLRASVQLTAFQGLDTPSCCNTAFAVPSEDGGFCPVIKLPSLTTCGLKSAALEYLPPFCFKISSRRNGTIFVKPTASSSVFENPVTAFPLTSGVPSAALVCRKTQGAWHTADTGLPAACIFSISAIESRSSVKSHNGPWPPG